MAGGSGTRLWPLSREYWPKQFLTLGGGEHTLLQQATLRAKSIAPNSDPLVMTNEELRFVAARQLAEVEIDSDIIAESVGRGTAMLACIAALYTLQKNAEGIVLLMPSDAWFQDDNDLVDRVHTALPLARQGYLTMLGVNPARADATLGYMKMGGPLGGGFRVSRFVEKPSSDVAEQMLLEGHYLWNIGLHIFQAQTMLEEMAQYSPDILEAAQATWDECSKHSSNTIHLCGDAWESARSTQVDNAVVEKSKRVAAVAYSGKWSDLGSYDALWRHDKKDDDGNVVHGQIITVDCRNNYIRAPRRTVTALGIKNTVVIADGDFVLIADREQSYRAPELLKIAKEKDWDDPTRPIRVHRPWGWFETMVSRPNYSVKRLLLWPGQAISLQSHKHRSERWVIVRGSPELVLDDETSTMQPDDTCFIPKGSTHRLSNKNVEPVEWIEVQTGSYFGEDDIQRYEDVYGRSVSPVPPIT